MGIGAPWVTILVCWHFGAIPPGGITSRAFNIYTIMFQTAVQAGRHSYSGRHTLGQAGRHSYTGCHTVGQAGRHSYSGRHTLGQAGRHSTGFPIVTIIWELKVFYQKITHVSRRPHQRPDYLRLQASPLASRLLSKLVAIVTLAVIPEGKLAVIP